MKPECYLAVGMQRRKDMALLSSALISSAVRNLRWCKEGTYYYVRLPNTRAANATWLGFMAGMSRSRGFGYVLDPATSKNWQKTFPKD